MAQSQDPLVQSLAVVHGWPLAILPSQPMPSRHTMVAIEAHAFELSSVHCVKHWRVPAVSQARLFGHTVKLSHPHEPLTKTGAAGSRRAHAALLSGVELQLPLSLQNGVAPLHTDGLLTHDWHAWLAVSHTGVAPLQGEVLHSAQPLAAQTVVPAQLAHVQVFAVQVAPLPQAPQTVPSFPHATLVVPSTHCPLLQQPL